MVYLTADHGGAELAAKVLAWLQERYGHVVVETTPRPRAGDDYPKQALSLVRQMKKDSQALGIAVCRSGVGMAMAINRFRDFRAVYADRPVIAAKARTDEDANVLTLGADYLLLPMVKKIVVAFLETEYRPVVRYTRRIQELRRYGQA